MPQYTQQTVVWKFPSNEDELQRLNTSITMNYSMRGWSVASIAIDPKRDAMIYSFQKPYADDAAAVVGGPDALLAAEANPPATPQSALRTSRTKKKKAKKSAKKTKSSG